MAGAMQPWHWIVLLVVVLLLFGSSRLPGLAKSVGQSMKIFKKEVKDLRGEDKSESADGSADGNAADNAPGASTRSTTASTASSDSTPGLISNRDRDIPKA